MFRVAVSEEIFCTQLCGIKYFYTIEIIFEQIYLTYTCDFKSTNTPGKSRPGNNGTKEYSLQHA